MPSSWWWIACPSGFTPSPQSPPWTLQESPSVGGIMVLCVTRLYKPVLALRTSQSLRVRNPTTGMLFFDRIYKNPFSTSSKLWLLGRIIHCWKGLDEEIAAPLESKETVQ